MGSKGIEAIDSPIFLWNVFPLHPRESGEPFSNRSHNAAERHIGEELLAELIRLVRPRRLFAIGNDAARSTSMPIELAICVVVPVSLLFEELGDGGNWEE